MNVTLLVNLVLKKGFELRFLFNVIFPAILSSDILARRCLWKKLYTLGYKTTDHKPLATFHVYYTKICPTYFQVV